MNAKTYVPTAVLAWIIKSNENPDGSEIRQEVEVLKT
jgi:hypothetical protein